MRIGLKSLAAAAFFTLATPAGAEVVCRVYDGDTFTTVNEQTGQCNGTRVRLSGIDAPELKQPYGKEARDFLARMVRGKDVTLSCSGSTYDRQACGVTLKQADIEREMVLSGWAFDFPKYSKGRYADAEAEAQANKRGLWGLIKDGGERPWDYRQRIKEERAAQKEWDSHWYVRLGKWLWKQL